MTSGTLEQAKLINGLVNAARLTTPTPDGYARVDTLVSVVVEAFDTDAEDVHAALHAGIAQGILQPSIAVEGEGNHPVRWVRVSTL